MKVQIALVGGQMMPVCIGLLEGKPDLALLVYSSITKGQAEKIAGMGLGQTEMRLFAPVDITSIMASAGNLLNEFADDEVTVNLTSGTKSWAIAFTLLSQGRKNVELIYVDQNCTFYNYTTGTKWQTQVTLSMEQIMNMNGQVAKKHILLSEYTDDDLHTLKEVKELRNRATKQFNQLTIPDKSWSKHLSGSNRGIHQLPDGSYVQWSKSDHNVHLSVNKGKYWIDKIFDSPHSFNIVFNSGWFEYEVAKLVSRWSHAEEVWMNVVYPYRGGQAKNEIDVLVNTGTKMLMIECKTQIFDNTDIDRFHTAVKNYGGLGCKALFVTESPMKPMPKEKCADSQILTFSMSDYSSKEEACKQLFEMLDHELFNINAK